MKNHLIACMVAVVIAACELGAQTRIDLRNQSKLMDFSQADATKPMRTGNALPSTCLSGELFLLLTGPVGTNVFACISPNVWVAQDGGAAALLARPIPRLVDYVTARCQKGTASSAFNTLTGSAPTAQCEAESTTAPVYGYLVFPKSATVYSVQDAFKIPQDTQWIKGNIVWRTTATTGSTVWHLQTACAVNPANAVWSAPDIVSSEAPPVAKRWETAVVDFDATGCAGKRMFWRVARASDDLLDTVAAPAELVQIVFDLE